MWQQGAGDRAAWRRGGALGACEPVAPPEQRVVRLTFAQVENTYTALLGPEARTALEAASVLSDGRHREFAALFAEGDLFNTDVLHRTRTRAEAAAGTVRARLSAITGCAAATDSACTDVFGGTLLDNTIVPYVTEVSRATHKWTQMPVVVFGGKSVGLKGGQFLTFQGRPHNDMWLSIAQALGVTVENLAGEKILTGRYQGPLTQMLA
jgi:hypothetical protein